MSTTQRFLSAFGAAALIVGAANAQDGIASKPEISSQSAESFAGLTATDIRIDEIENEAIAASKGYAGMGFIYIYGNQGRQFKPEDVEMVVKARVKAEGGNPEEVSFHSLQVDGTGAKMGYALDGILHGAYSPGKVMGDIPGVVGAHEHGKEQNPKVSAVLKPGTRQDRDLARD